MERREAARQAKEAKKEGAEGDGEIVDGEGKLKKKRSPKVRYCILCRWSI